MKVRPLLAAAILVTVSGPTGAASAPTGVIASARPAALQEPSGSGLDSAAAANTAHAGAPEPRPAGEEHPNRVSLTAAQEARARSLEGELRCPVCRSQSIRQSRSFMADDMRRKVRAMIAEGRSDDEIRAYFIDRYGTWVLLTPPRRGFNLAAYAFPAIVVLIGAVGLVVAARRWKRAPRPTPPGPPPPSRHLAILERELEETER
jgi:cytochrome c-type biogenesis protein CcmH